MNLDGALSGDPDGELEGPIEVFRGVIQTPRGAFKNRDRRLERWLLESGVEVIPADLQDLVRSELEKEED